LTNLHIPKNDFAKMLSVQTIAKPSGFSKISNNWKYFASVLITAVVVFALTVWGILALGLRPVTTDTMPLSVVHPDHFPTKGFSAGFTYDYITHMLNQDVVPSHNLASFTTTWMEPQAKALVEDAMIKNFADKHEYAGTEAIHRRCITMMAELFHAPGVADNGSGATENLGSINKAQYEGVGTATVGSSEAFMLAGLAMKFYWREQRKAKGLPYDKPNVIMPSTSHLSLKQFAKFFDVELRVVGVSTDRYVTLPENVIPLVDENTIGIVSILGSTYNGQFEDIKGLSDALEKLNAEKGWDVGIHVDGASGAFVAPFLYPEYQWDFRLPLVRSINTSGHKYGLVFAGVGWLVFRESKYLPDSLYQRYNYLGGGEKASFSINFSKPSHQVTGQYYNFMRLGFDGYTAVMKEMKRQAELIAKDIQSLGIFKINAPNTEYRLPVTAFYLDDQPRIFTEFDLADKLAEKGWMVPAYKMVPRIDQPDHQQNLMRIVTRNDFNDAKRTKLMRDMRAAIAELSAGVRHK
jgi:glutamate decarboxylase